MRQTSVGKKSRAYLLMDELVIGVPTTFVSDKHGCMVVHGGINFPSSGSDA